MDRVKVEIEIELPIGDEPKLVERQRVKSAVHDVATRIGEESSEGIFRECATETKFKLKEVEND